MMNFLKDYWHIISAILLLATSLGMTYQKVEDHGRRLTTLEQALAVMPQINEKLDTLINRQ